MLFNVESKKNEAFAITCIEALFESEKMNERLLQILLDKEMCENVIGGKYRKSILKEIEGNIGHDELKEQCMDGTDRPRYYNTVLRWSGRDFIVTNYWYGPKTKMPDNRTPFLKWIQAHI